MSGGDLHHVGVTVAARELYNAEPVPSNRKAERFGVDRCRFAECGAVGKIVAVQADGHRVQLVLILFTKGYAFCRDLPLHPLSRTVNMPREAPTKRIAFAIVTGFLGAGKTTLINRLLRSQGLADALARIRRPSRDGRGQAGFRTL